MPPIPSKRLEAADLLGSSGKSWSSKTYHAPRQKLAAPIPTPTWVKTCFQQLRAWKDGMINNIDGKKERYRRRMEEDSRRMQSDG